MRSRFSELTCPFLVLQGDQDRVIDSAGSQMLYENASSVNKRLKVTTFHSVCSRSLLRKLELPFSIFPWKFPPNGNGYGRSIVP